MAQSEKAQNEKQVELTTPGTGEGGVLSLPWDKLWPFFGLWTMVDWIYWFNKTPLRDGIAEPWWFGIYPAMTIIMCAAFGFFVLRQQELEAGNLRRLDVILATLTVACIVSVVANGLTVSNALWDLANSALAGLCMSWGYLRWAKVYFSMQLRDVVACLCVAYFVGSGLKVALDAVSGIAGALIAFSMPLICLVSLRKVEARDEPAPVGCGELLYRPGTFKPLVRIFLWIFLFLIVARYCIGDRPWASPTGGILGHMLELGLAGLGLLWVVKWDRPLDFPMVWRFVFLFFSLALVCKALPWEWCGQALRCSNQVAVSLLVMVLWMLLVDISHHCSWHPCATFSLGWAAYVGSRWAAQAIGHFVPASELGAAGGMVGLWILAVAVIFMLSTSNPHIRRFFADLQPPVVETVRYTNLDDRCTTWGTEFGLTDRELDVLRLLARGHSKGYIAETLSLSENTVRNHVKHIYGKTGVHGRDELRAALDG